MKDIFLKLVEAANIKTQAAVTLVVEDIIFPWYEAKTGKYHSNRVIRKQIAKRIEQDLSQTIWVQKASVLDGLEAADPSKFLVSEVFPQSRGDGQYDLMVTLFEKGFTYNVATISLEDFLRDFFPLESLTFSDYNS